MSMESNHPPPGPALSPQALQLHWQQTLDAVAQLTQLDLTPANFFGEFLRRAVEAWSAPAAAVWGQRVSGAVPLEFEINLAQLGLDRNDEAHQHLLAQALQLSRAVVLPPYSSFTPPGGTTSEAGNPTNAVAMLVPI